MQRTAKRKSHKINSPVARNKQKVSRKSSSKEIVSQNRALKRSPEKHGDSMLKKKKKKQGALQHEAESSENESLQLRLSSTDEERREDADLEAVEARTDLGEHGDLDKDSDEEEVGDNSEEQEDIDIEDDHEADTVDQEEPTFLGSTRKHTPGIIYLSYIPEGLTVAKTREILQDFGNVGRIYFEPIKKLTKKTRPTHRFAEGWVEFQKKKVAKQVAQALNSKPVGGKRRTPYHDALWSMKYLHRFRWTHLSERLAYEKAVKDQRLRTEIAQAKRESSYYAKALERSIRMKKKRKMEAETESTDQQKDKGSSLKLRKTDKEIRSEKNEGSKVDKNLLMSIFSK